MLARITLTHETAKELDCLENRIRRVGDYRVLRRIGAIRAYVAGISVSTIAEVVGLAEQTVRNWCHDFIAHGVATLKYRPPRLTKTQKRELCTMDRRKPVGDGVSVSVLDIDHGTSFYSYRISKQNKLLFLANLTISHGQSLRPEFLG